MRPLPYVRHHHLGAAAGRDNVAAGPHPARILDVKYSPRCGTTARSGLDPTLALHDRRLKFRAPTDFACRHTSTARCRSAIAISGPGTGWPPVLKTPAMELLRATRLRPSHPSPGRWPAPRRLRLGAGPARVGHASRSPRRRTRKFPAARRLRHLGTCRQDGCAHPDRQTRSGLDPGWRCTNDQ